MSQSGGQYNGMKESRSEGLLLRRNLQLEVQSFERSLRGALKRSSSVRETVNKAKLADIRFQHACLLRLTCCQRAHPPQLTQLPITVALAAHPSQDYQKQ